MSEAEAILRLELDPERSDFTKVLTRKQAVIASVLSATVRVTANRLRGRERDRMAEVIEAIAEQKAKMALLA